MFRVSFVLGLVALGVSPAAAEVIEVSPSHIEAHERFLTSDALRGRGSATNDEAVAAAYVAAQFQAFGLKPPPGTTAYLQSAPVPATNYTRKIGIAEDARTTNALGFLPGTDPKAGILLVTAHLDHLGMKDGKIFPGANDDASGTVAVLELARVLAAKGPYRRGILFAAYGSEELGGVGSTYFAAHPPVPLEDIAANIEFEMIGRPDPQLPAGSLMMTGFDRSNLGQSLKQHGASVVPDPYPDQHFFERSDNYFLALHGVVAHTVSGWPLLPSYHQPSDTVDNLDLAFMARSIQSLVEPVRWLADSDFRPAWNKGGAPKPQRKE